jgi:hypothetical protein
LCFEDDVMVPSISTSPQSHGLPVLGQTLPFPFFPALPLALPLLPLLPPLVPPVAPLLPLAPLLPWWPFAALLAAIASSVYAAGSTFANALKASKMGRYPVQRLQEVSVKHEGQAGEVTS